MVTRSQVGKFLEEVNRHHEFSERSTVSPFEKKTVPMAEQLNSDGLLADGREQFLAKISYWHARCWAKKIRASAFGESPVDLDSLVEFLIDDVVENFENKIVNNGRWYPAAIRKEVSAKVKRVVAKILAEKPRGNSTRKKPVINNVEEKPKEVAPSRTPFVFKGFKRCQTTISI